MNNAPLVSIGVPVYNGEKSLARTLDCLLGQTYRNIELILSDNASTDATAQICQKYCAQDPRIRYVRQEKNLGLPGNWTFVAEQATGEFFMWAAADDHWEPEFVEVLVNKLLAEPDAILAFCPYRLFNKETQEQRGSDRAGKAPTRRVIKIGDARLNDMFIRRPEGQTPDRIEALFGA